jgi:hypothetical protein
MASGAFSHPRGAIALGDVVESEEALAATGMRGTQGLLAQGRQRLTPTLMVNV